MGKNNKNTKEFYAVACGRFSGHFFVCTVWAYAERHVTRVPGNKHRGFATFKQARKYLQDEGCTTFHFITQDKLGEHSETGPRYAVADGKNPGIYSTWREAEKQVQGYSGACYKKVGSEEKARGFIEVYNETSKVLENSCNNK